MNGEQAIEGRVNPSIRPMNFGVNKGALIKFPAQGLMGWWCSDAQNKASREKLGCFSNRNTLEWGDIQKGTAYVVDNHLVNTQDLEAKIESKNKEFNSNPPKIPKNIPELSPEKKARVWEIIYNNPAFLLSMT